VTALAQVVGWLLLVSVAQAAIVTGVVCLALRVVPQDLAGLRHGIALGGLVVVTVAFAGTATLALADWRTHVDCWERAEEPGATGPAECRSHGVPADRLEAEAATSGKIAAVLGWIPGSHVPALPQARDLAHAWTGVANVVGALWLAALVLLAARRIRDRRALRAVLAGSRPILDADALGALRGLAVELGLRGPVPLRESSAVSTPCVAGTASPVILLPEGLLAALRPRELRAVLAHELAHVRRRDLLAVALQRMAGLLFCFNPFVGRMSRRACVEREVACDRIGAALGARSRTEYAGTLLVLEGFGSMPGASRLALPFLGESELSGRVRRLLASPARRRAARAATLFLAALSIAAVGLLLRTSLTVTALGSWAVMAEDIERREARID
jgi:beta-lactamase regulating signal transducer with metallopeptidase domain